MVWSNVIWCKLASQTAHVYVVMKPGMSCTTYKVMKKRAMWVMLLCSVQHCSRQT